MIVKNINEYLLILKQFQSLFTKTKYGTDFIFRGTDHKDWPLIPNIFRKYQEEEQGQTNTRVYKYEATIIDHFKKEAILYLPNISLENDQAWLEYAQHYGAPTRLLDFTKNPLVALFFACKEETKEDAAVAIINYTNFHNWSFNDPFCKGLHTPTRDEMIYSILKGAGLKTPVQYRIRTMKQKPVIFVPSYINPRIGAQSSVFMIWGEIRDTLEDMINEENYMVVDKNSVKSLDDQRFLSKVTIDGSSKASILKELDLLGINEKTIFPGLDGIGKYIEKQYRTHANDPLFID